MNQRQSGVLQKGFIHAAIIALLVVIGYANSLHNGFLMDDNVDLFSPQGVATKTLGTVFTRPQVNIYRPFSHFFCFLAYKAFGADPFPYHLTNLVLFIAVCLLFYMIVLRLTGDQTWAFLTGVLFGLHPVNNMMVNYISAIQICVYVIVTQLAFLFFLLWRQRGERPALYALSLVFYLFCLASHEMSYFFPFIIVCALHFLEGVPARKIARASAPYFVMAAAYFLFRAAVFKIHSAYEGPDHILPHLGVYLSTYLELITWYLTRLMVPVEILFLWAARLDYRILNYEAVNYLAIELGAYKTIVFDYLVLLFMMAFPLYLIFGKWKRGLRAFLLAVFMIGMFTVGYAGFVYFPTAKPIIEPHWFYFTSIGFFVLLAYALLLVKRRLPVAPWGLIVVFVCSGYLVSLRHHNEKWADQETYCRWWISLNTDNMTPYYWLTKTLMERGDYLGAARLIEGALKGVYTLDEKLAADLGYAYIKLGLLKEGYGNLQYSARVGGLDYAPLHYYFGEYFMVKKDFAAAKEAYATAVKLDPYEPMYRDRLDSVRRVLNN